MVDEFARVISFSIGCCCISIRLLRLGRESDSGRRKVIMVFWQWCRLLRWVTVAIMIMIFGSRWHGGGESRCGERSGRGRWHEKQNNDHMWSHSWFSPVCWIDCLAWSSPKEILKLSTIKYSNHSALALIEFFINCLLYCASWRPVIAFFTI